jgi:hypothetical protein
MIIRKKNSVKHVCRLQMVSFIPRFGFVPPGMSTTILKNKNTKIIKRDIKIKKIRSVDQVDKKKKKIIIKKNDDD